MFKNIVLATVVTVLFCHAATSMAASEGVFNPSVSLILSGTYAQLQQDPATPATGFAMNPNPVHAQGFNIGESELGIAANIDPDFRGGATLALDAEGTFSVENAFVQSTSLGNGLNLKLGRFFSGLGYLNEVHAHAWDFVDQPLVYGTFWNNQLGEDGLQFKWLAPLNLFVELGGEMGKGRGFPGTDTPKNGSGMGVLFAHIGDDIGVEQSWRMGFSLHQTQRVKAESANVPDSLGNLLTNQFSGDSRTAGLDFIWKYSPNGNIRERYLKVQGEYFRRDERGNLSYDTATGGANVTDTFALTQSGFYVQSVYQFMPRWRMGARYDRLDSGLAQLGATLTKVISDYAFSPTRTSVMLDFSPSEFSRLRLQFAQDNSRQNAPDNQVFVQYIMSLGAHGAHQY
jgi:hypothetical protein